MQVQWKVISASVSGTSHRKQGTPCQDAHHYALLEGSVLLIAVADGAGSAPFSHEGARLVVDRAVDFLYGSMNGSPPADEKGWEASIQETFEHSRQSLLDLAAQNDMDSRDFATTLTLAMANSHWLAAGQVGDGAVVAKSDDSPLFLVCSPQRGEYANETSFLTADNALDCLESRVYPKLIAGLAVMTDGLLRLAFNMPNMQPHSPFFHPLFSFLDETAADEDASEQLSSFLDSERINLRTDDDKTLVLASRTRVGATE